MNIRILNIGVNWWYCYVTEQCFANDNFKRGGARKFVVIILHEVSFSNWRNVCIVKITRYASFSPIEIQRKCKQKTKRLLKSFYCESDRRLQRTVLSSFFQFYNFYISLLDLFIFSKLIVLFLFLNLEKNFLAFSACRKIYGQIYLSGPYRASSLDPWCDVTIFCSISITLNQWVTIKLVAGLLNYFVSYT